MPTYEYQCKTCGGVFDVFQSIKASPLRKARCEKCGGSQPVRRLISTGGAVLFKGSGFYQTDYRSESYKNAAKAESPSKDSGDKKETPTKNSSSSTPPSTPPSSTPKTPESKDKS